MTVSARALSYDYPANLGLGESLFGWFCGPGSVRFALAGFEVSESFFLVSDSVSERAECGAEVIDFGGEAGEGAGVVAAVAVFFDDGS